MRNKLGQFVKGQPSENPEGLKKGQGWNKGKKGWTNNGSFKKGHEVSTEIREAVSVTQKGNTHRRGSIHTEEANEKNRKAHLGKVTVSGETHPNWKGGVTPEHRRIYHSKKYASWRKEIFERDKYVCQRCNTDGYLQPHHINNFAQFPESRFVIDNGITFCKNCHREFHKIFGQINNNKKQVDGFVIGQNI